MSDEKKVTLLDLFREHRAGDPVPSLQEMADKLYASLTPLEKEVYHARMAARGPQPPTPEEVAARFRAPDAEQLREKLDAAAAREPSIDAPLSEYTSITAAEAPEYCKGSERQRVRDVIRERVGDRTVLDYGCGPGIDAGRYAPEQYTGMDVSDQLIRYAEERHPAHLFQKRMLPTWGATLPRDCVMIKSVLEHTPTVEDAVALLKNAMEIAREEVFVAWHTPPGLFEVRQRVVGHFGKLVHQNTYDMRAFEFARPRRVERVDNFELWTIDVRKAEKGFEKVLEAFIPDFVPAPTTKGVRMPVKPEREVTVLMPAGIVEDFVMVMEEGALVAFYTKGASFQDQRLYVRGSLSPTGPFDAEERVLDPSEDTEHTRLYKGIVTGLEASKRNKRLISAIWPGLPRCGIWCFTDIDIAGLMTKTMVIPPGPPGSGYSYAAANPCVRQVDWGKWEIFFEGCDPLTRPGQPDWKIFRATWDGRGLAVVDPVPVIEGANPSLLEHEGKTYLYFSRLTPGGYAAGFETCVTVLE